MPLDAPAPFRAGRVALVGRPNVGKSTLLNSLVGQSLAAVSRKPQTTRVLVRGIVQAEGFQLVVEDTPGFLQPRSALDRAMVHAVRRAVTLADLVALVAPPWVSHTDADLGVLGALGACEPIIVVITKIDLVSKPTLLPLIERFAAQPGVREVVPVSAKERDGIDLLATVMARYVPEGPPLYPPDQLTDQPERFFVTEILREQILMLYHQEVPYATAVEVDEFVEREKGKDYIRATIWVERESQRGILVGKGGLALKRLGTRAREAVERLLGRPVYLELAVKVRRDWRDREEDVARFGFVP